nr:MAG TPA: hypothetical protein [Caudoviricetes sp.]
MKVIILKAAGLQRIYGAAYEAISDSPYYYADVKIGYATDIADHRPVYSAMIILK